MTMMMVLPDYLSWHISVMRKTIREARHSEGIAVQQQCSSLNSYQSVNLSRIVFIKYCLLLKCFFQLLFIGTIYHPCCLSIKMYHLGKMPHPSDGNWHALCLRNVVAQTKCTKCSQTIEQWAKCPSCEQNAAAVFNTHQSHEIQQVNKYYSLYLNIVHMWKCFCFSHIDMLWFKQKDEADEKESSREVWNRKQGQWSLQW